MVNAKSTRGNRSTVPSCDAIKGGPGGGRSITRHHGSTPPTTSQLSTQTPSPLPTRRRAVFLSRASRRGRGQDPWPVTSIKQRSCPSPFHWQHGPTRTETTATTTLATRRRGALPSHASRQSGGQGHCDRGVEWRGRLGSQESLGGRHAEETSTDPRAAGGQPARGRQHASSMARVSRAVTL